MLQNTPIDRWENGEQSESKQKREKEREKLEREGETLLFCLLSIQAACCSNVAGRYHLVTHTIHLRSIPAHPGHTVLHCCLRQPQDLHIHL